MPQPSIPKISFKITYLKFYSNFPGASELRVWSIIRKGRHYFKKNFTYLVSSDLYWQIGETIFKIRHVSKLNGNVMKSMSFKIGMSKDSRQARFFLVSALYFFKNFQSSKLHFYQYQTTHLPIWCWNLYCRRSSVASAALVLTMWDKQPLPSIRFHLIRSSDNDSTGFWPPGSLHTLGADGHI